MPKLASFPALLKGLPGDEREETTNLLNALDLLPLSLLLIDAELRETFANNHFLRFIDAFSLNMDLLQKSIVTSPVLQNILSGKTGEEEQKIPLEGSNLSLSCSMSPLNLKGRRFLLLSAGESSRNDLQEELKREHRELRDLYEEKKKQYRRVVHDLKNPLGNIGVNINLIQVMGKLNESQSECFDIIEKDVENMSEMLHSLLEMEKRDSLSNLEKLDLSGLVRLRANQFAHSAEAKGLVVRTEISDKPLYISAEPLTIISVIDNLIGNAIKYSEKGNIRVTAERKADRALLAVKDEGRGISEEEMPRLFQEFYRPTNHEASEGHGLGLHLIKKIIEKQGGRIEVDSAVASGTEFRVFLPLFAEN